jgi:DNA-binding FrmR family transcriptional regulator
MNADIKKKMQTRVSRIAGQIAGVQKMVDEDRYCVDVLNQIAAVRSALDSLGVELLTKHLESCVMGHGTGTEHHCATPMTKDELLAEIQAALSRFLK